MDPLVEALSAAAGDLEVALAGERDLAEFSAILCEAARWLIERGEPLWDPDDLVPERLRDEQRAGVLWLARLDGEPVGTLALRWQDRLFWPDAPDGESAFLHRLAVRRRVAGRGVAPALVAWAEARAREASRRWLRLDCSADHPGLARYYEGLGFQRHSRGTLGRFQFLRYQKALRVDSPS